MLLKASRGLHVKKMKGDNKMSTYKGLFVRSFQGDTNVYPKPSESLVWTSPDIIPYGVNVCNDPTTEFLGENFDKQFSEDIIGDIQNYVYVRGENKSGGLLNGRMYLYASDSTMLLAPSTWENIRSTKNKEYVQFRATAEDRIVCNGDDDGIFAFRPTKSDGHTCLISRIVTEQHPAPIPDLKDITDFSIFLRTEQSMGFAQRNLRYVDAFAPSHTATEQLSNPFQTAITDAYVVLSLYALPKDTEIQMTCSGSRPGCNVELPRMTITDDTYDNPKSIGRRITNMPSGFNYPVNVYFWGNGKTIDYRFKIVIDFLAVFAPDSKAYRYGSPMSDLPLDLLYDDGEVLKKQAIPGRIDSIGPRQFIRVGSCTYTVKV